MGLKDLISEDNQGSLSKRKSSKSKKKKRSEGFPDLEAEHDHRCITVIDCSQGCGGKGVPVKGLNKHGYVYRCSNMFCEKSIFNWDDKMGDGDPVEIHGDIVEGLR